MSTTFVSVFFSSLSFLRFLSLSCLPFVRKLKQTFSFRRASVTSRLPCVFVDLSVPVRSGRVSGCTALLFCGREQKGTGVQYKCAIRSLALQRAMPVVRSCVQIEGKGNERTKKNYINQRKSKWLNGDPANQLADARTLLMWKTAQLHTALPLRTGCKGGPCVRGGGLYAAKLAAFHAAKCFASVLNARLPTPPENATKITEALSDEPRGRKKAFQREGTKKASWEGEGRGGNNLLNSAPVRLPLIITALGR